MGRLAGVVVVVEDVALVEERRIGAIQVFGGDILLQRAAAERDGPPPRVEDREHDAIAEAVIGNRDVLALHQQPGLDHGLGGHALAGEMVAQRITVGGRIADAEMSPRIVHQAAAVEVCARLGARATLELALEKGGGQRHDVDQRLGLPLLLLGFLRDLGQGDPGDAGQPLHRLGERQTLRLHHEGEDVAMLARREVVVEALLVVDEKRGRPLGVEGREPLPLTPRLLQAHALAHDLRNRKPSADLIEEAGREAHCYRCMPTEAQSQP